MLNKPSNSTRANRRVRGISLIYLTLILVVLCAFVSLSVDIGRVQLAKTELRRAADAAAIYAAESLPNGVSSVQAAATTAAGENTCDGTAVAVQNSDVEFGTWSTTNRTFTVLTGSSRSSANAVRVTVLRTTARGNPISLTFARVLGRSTFDVSAKSTALYTAGISVNQNIPAMGNPFLAGMPAGSIASTPNVPNDPDYAGTSSDPKSSPIQATMSVTDNQAITFDSVSGNAANGPGITDSGPDGDTTSIGHNNLTTLTSNNNSTNFYNENGIADARMPINCTVGLFLDDSQPDSTAAPSSNLDFSTPASRDFTTLQPQLKQVFFIGTGTTSTGVQQTFIAPKGATRLFLGTWDFYEWSNNSGSRNVVINRPASVSLVQ